VQVYRNGQILLPTQYTIPTNAAVVIGSTAFKLGENYTVIFPKGGGGSGSGGSGSLTSISGGTGITVSPDPITTTGTVSADLTVLMELSDTVTLSNRINNKVNISDTATMLLPYFRDADTSLLNLTSRFALKLNGADTASLSNRINAKGTGTVTSVGSGFGLLGGTITTTGTLRLDTSTIYARLQDSINVAIGSDTIKILKQEYNAASSSVLTWTITPKFPIQLKAYILVFRNGQLLNNDQYNLTDTNQITIVSTSFKVGANYTVATVSGIGSVGTGVFPNAVYPEAGIALSTGSAWASSITNNSANWNIAYNDKINNAAFTGTDTKTLTLTQLDGGTLTPTFTDLQGVTGVTAGTGLTGGTITTTGTVAVDFGVVAPLANPTFTGTVGGITKSMVGLGNVDNTSDANKPISTATQTALNLKFNTADTTSLNLTSRFAAKLNYTDTSFLFTQSDTNQLNLTNRFAAKQNTLNGSGFVKASGTNISYDNSSYLRTSLADSTYLKLTGGTLTGALNGTSAIFSGNVAIGFPFAYKPFEVFSNINNFVSVGVTYLSPYAWSGIHFGYREADSLYRKSAIIFQRNEAGPADASGKIHLLNVNSFEGGRNADLRDAKLTIGNNGFVGINDTTPSYNLDVNGTLGVTGAATLSSTLAVQGDITENGNNVLTSADTTNMLAPYTKIANAITGSGTLNYLPLYSSSNTLSNSIIRQPNTDEIFVNGGATFNNGLVQAQQFRSPFTVSSSCGSSGGPNLIGTSTGNYVNICSTGTAYLLLPDPAANFNRLLTITNLRSDQSIVLNTSGSYSNARPLGINGASESSIPAKRWITVQSNAFNWYIIATGSAL